MRKKERKKERKMSALRKRRKRRARGNETTHTQRERERRKRRRISLSLIHRSARVIQKNTQLINPLQAPILSSILIAKERAEKNRSTALSEHTKPPKKRTTNATRTKPLFALTSLFLSQSSKDG